MLDDEDEFTEEELETWDRYVYEHFKSYETRDPSMPMPPPPKNKKKRHWTVLREKKKEVKRIL